MPTEVQISFHVSTLKRFRLPPTKSLLFRILLVAIAGLAFVWIDHMIGIVFLFGGMFARRNVGISGTNIAVLICALGLASVNAATTVDRFPDYAAGEFLAKIVLGGDIIGIYEDSHHYISPYLMHFYLGDHQLQFVEWDGRNVDFLLSVRLDNYTGYELIAVFNHTKSEGVLDSAYRALNYRVRTLLGLSLNQGPPLQGDLFLYRSTL